jgi:hypothetical protein
MAKKKKTPKKLKKQKPVAAKAKKIAPKAKVTVKAKAVAKAKTAAKPKSALKKKRVTTKVVVQGKSQNVETVRLKPKALVARAGAGGGDFGGVSIVEDVDSESADELLEEGQAFEAGIVSGVEDAPDPDEAEVTTREVPQDDVPGEYKDKDRP